MTRFLLFIFCYSVIVVTIANMIFYFNYTSLGYDAVQIICFIVQSADFMAFILSVIVLLFIVYVPSPSRPPFFGE